MGSGVSRLWLVGLMALVLCGLETGLRLGAASPDTRYTLPQFSLGYFWDTPLGWTGVVDGVPVNKDSVQFSSLAGFFRDEPAVQVPVEDNVYVRFAGYSLLGSVMAPLVGAYASFVLVNVLLWVAAALATYALAVRLTGSALTATLAALLVSTAPAFEALVGQALPYVASYSVFVLGLWLFDRLSLFARDTPPRTALACGLVGGLGFVFYDLYMLPAFVVAYGVFRRMPLRNLALVLVAMALPRLAWSGYWQLAQLASYSHNETHPAEALAAWFDPARMGQGLARLKAYVLLGAHGLLNIGAAFLFWPVLLAVFELGILLRRRAPAAAWFVAVAVAGFAPALFMLSTWPHIPRWYAYGFPAVYILAAAAAVRIARSFFRADSSHWAFVGMAVVVVLPAIVLSNLDVVGATRPMELLLFQPTHWSYLWSR
ncbi:MAG TPA: hypothetical protein VKV73_06955 [Chloroflexota bacterium]|nr:hypothetical protein [Chloroflexota bacterium]